MKRKLILYIAASLDGYIAKPGDDLGFLSVVEKEGEDYGYGEFIKTVDTVIMGRKTYDWITRHVPDYVHADKSNYIITRTPQPAADNIIFYTGDIKSLIEQLKAADGKNIFCDGGAEIVDLLLQQKLIDEIVVSIIPILVGDGIRLFKDGRPEQNMELISTRYFEKGLVQLHYRCK
ncbi:dihydrofolate reductase family protein [Flavihumibacter petaseus]|uniref:Putative oxidoreductase n=1 Tax=Flavihumibacter petaseus NBRC 106054 TaxID=1220578 RepID=A0A0E9N1R8_9BACT|nr:dihydrofolate reductase family protein [Flavihumibacter petaseus]GAO43576.1 putative oxidoreductase [Flavihumibacter petaseus NBRC 106054]